MNVRRRRCIGQWARRCALRFSSLVLSSGTSGTWKVSRYFIVLSLSVLHGGDGDDEG